MASPDPAASNDYARPTRKLARTHARADRQAAYRRRTAELESAIDRMAGRLAASNYGEGLRAMDTDPAKCERSHRAAHRQYRALMRLTTALRRHADSQLPR